MNPAKTGALALAAFALLAQPILADAGYDRWVRDFWPQARAKGVSKSTYRAAFRGMKPDPEILERAESQLEFVTPIWEYLARTVTDKRIETGREMLRTHRRVLDAIEARYGVDREYVVAIWGMESSYGAVLDNPKIVKPVIRSLSTLAYKGGRRARFGRAQLLAALQILENGDVKPRGMLGSWAGAMGHTQFIPTTYAAYAVDFTGDGKRNIWTSIPDALASTANYLKVSGFREGQTWGYEVALPRGFDYALADSRKKKRTLAEWQRLGVQRANGRAFPRLSDEAYVLLPAGSRGPAFLILRNFRAILRYNNADAYAMAVGHLADRLIGGNPFYAPWLENDRTLSRTERKELQKALNRRGLDTGGVDGKIGPRTLAAVRNYQANSGLVADGFASYTLLQRLRAGR